MLNKTSAMDVETGESLEKLSNKLDALKTDKNGHAPALSKMLLDGPESPLMSLPTPSSRQRMSVEDSDALQRRVEKQKKLIERLRQEISERTAMLENLRSGLRTYKSLGMTRKPSHAEREEAMSTGSTVIEIRAEAKHDAMHFGDDESSKTDMTRRVVRALVFDCGTSETKALLFKYDSKRECKISMCEVHLDQEPKGMKRPGVIEYITNQTWDEGVVDTFSALYLKATAMQDEESGSSQHGGGLDFCIVGASAWARKLYERDELNIDKNRLLHELRESGLFPKIFPQKDESSFELLATMYAFSEGQNTGMIKESETFTGVLGSGGGSCQYTYYDEKRKRFPALNLEIGNREGRGLFISSATALLKRMSDATSKPSKEEIRAPIDAVEKWTADMANKIALRTSQAKAGGFEKRSGFVLCISAQYYAASELNKVLKGCVEKYGKFCNKDDKTATITAKRAKQCAREYLAQQISSWMSMDDEARSKLVSDKKALKKWALGFANVSICSTFWDAYLTDDATLCFKRDWVFGKDRIAYRTTWSAGWFIDILRTQKSIDLSLTNPRMKYVMSLIARNREKLDKKTTNFRLTHSKVAFYVNDMVSSHIGEIPSMAEQLRSVAKKKSEVTDVWIRDLEKILRGMKGSTEKTAAKGFKFRIKSQLSLERKIDSSIATLLLANAPFVGDGSYAPLEAEIVQKIRDCLRYTLVIDERNYYKGVVAIEDYLIAHDCEIQAKNFWQNPPKKEDRKTMYMGLNMRVWLKPDPIAYHYKNSRMPVELQVHTPESFDLKNNESHAIYEDIRTESVLARRDKLVAKAYHLWENVRVPQDSDMDPVCFSKYKGRKNGFTDEHKTYKQRKKPKKTDLKKCTLCRQPLPTQHQPSHLGKSRSAQ